MFFHKHLRSSHKFVVVKGAESCLHLFFSKFLKHDSKKLTKNWMTLFTPWSNWTFISMDEIVSPKFKATQGAVVNFCIWDRTFLTVVAAFEHSCSQFRSSLWSKVLLLCSGRVCLLWCAAFPITTQSSEKNSSESTVMQSDLHLNWLRLIQLFFEKLINVSAAYLTRVFSVSLDVKLFKPSPVRSNFVDLVVANHIRNIH